MVVCFQSDLKRLLSPDNLYPVTASSISQLFHIEIVDAIKLLSREFASCPSLYKAVFTCYSGSTNSPIITLVPDDHLASFVDSNNPHKVHVFSLINFNTENKEMINNRLIDACDPDCVRRFKITGVACSDLHPLSFRPTITAPTKVENNNLSQSQSQSQSVPAPIKNERNGSINNFFFKQSQQQSNSSVSTSKTIPPLSRKTKEKQATHNGIDVLVEEEEEEQNDSEAEFEKTRAKFLIKTAEKPRDFGDEFLKDLESARKELDLDEDPVFIIESNKPLLDGYTVQNNEETKMKPHANVTEDNTFLFSDKDDDAQNATSTKPITTLADEWPLSQLSQPSPTLQVERSKNEEKSSLEEDDEFCLPSKKNKSKIARQLLQDDDDQSKKKRIFNELNVGDEDNEDEEGKPKRARTAAQAMKERKKQIEAEEAVRGIGAPIQDYFNVDQDIAHRNNIGERSIDNVAVAGKKRVIVTETMVDEDGYDIVIRKEKWVTDDEAETDENACVNGNNQTCKKGLKPVASLFASNKGTIASSKIPASVGAHNKNVKQQSIASFFAKK